MPAMPPHMQPICTRKWGDERGTHHRMRVDSLDVSQLGVGKERLLNLSKEGLFKLIWAPEQCSCSPNTLSCRLSKPRIDGISFPALPRGVERRCAQTSPWSEARTQK